ncbi:SsrA-binding protein [Mycoplasma phocimorsus]|uniref:SsrA-binding protein n=1 Tax=Mycoplasma phocimorsus TaxID=3045839 RepID=UPI0024C00157|nr:SsrA-binding protein [Mycoplasma phocimorsus]MDJ1648944.1 SsrA-binding protein [Mycoplasma phocimorsus]
MIANNKSQIRNYEILNTYEAGIVLNGSEVKAIRAGHIDLKNSYCTIYKNELYVDECYIKEYMLEKSDTTRRRKLLLHKNEIKKLKGDAEKKQLTIIVKTVYWKHGKIKFEIALARGLKKFDKRAKLIEEETRNKIRKVMQNYM